MREIKFRVWDEHLRIMRDEDFCYRQFDIADIDRAGLVWMQYTGLKDSKGKEIYDGDIVKFSYCRKECIWPVKWGVSGWWASGRSAFKDLYWVADKCEIIGNIYENPELVE